MKTITKWNENISGKINGLRVIAYIDYLNKMCAINLPITRPIVGNLYYFKNETEYIFPKAWKNKFLLVRLYSVYPSANDDLGNPWKPKQGEEITEYTVTYWFYVIGLYDDENVFYDKNGVLSHAPVLHGFRNVIDDNNYYSSIPLINEIIHRDNGIISHLDVSVTYELNKNPDLWCDFKLIYAAEINPDINNIKILDDHHKFL